MKRIRVILVVSMLVILSFIPSTSNAQFGDILAATIEAIDVGVQKAQNAVIDLQNAEKQIENELSQTQLAQIADWTQQQKDLYSNYFTELWKVKSVITNFRKITSIIANQAQLVSEYKTAYAQVRRDPHFTPNEVNYIYSVLTGIVNESIQNIDQITKLLESFTVQMSDADRMRLIQHASDNIQREIGNLRAFNNQNAALSLQRATDQNDLNAIKHLYGLP